MDTDRYDDLGREELVRRLRACEAASRSSEGAELALREREEQLRLFAEHAPAAIAMLDTQMRYVVASRRWLADFGFAGQDLGGRSHYDVFPEIPERWKDVHRRCLAGAVERAEEDPFVRADGATQWIRWEVRPWYAATGVVGGIIIFSEDITARKQAELALRESEARLAGIVNSAMDAIVSVDAELRIVLFNKAAEKMFGYSAQEAMGMPLARLLPERFRSAHEQHVRDFSAAGVAVRGMGGGHETRGFRAGGEEFPIEATISQVDVGGQKLLTVIQRDISDRRLAEDALRQSAAELRAVSAKLAQAQEAERRAIARELHDQIGQSLTALSLNLTILREQLDGNAAQASASRVDDSLELVDTTAERVRGLMVELQPPLLDDYGLAAAFRWYARQVSERSGIAVSAGGQEPEPRLGREPEIALFRIAQEALTNVIKHAAAKHVDIALEPMERGARLTIADDGRGFDPAAVRSPHQLPGWGLRTMAERAAAVGGRLRIESAPGRGARVVVEIEGSQ